MFLINIDKFYLGVKELFMKGGIVVVWLLIFGVFSVVDKIMEEIFMKFLKFVGILILY